MNPIRSILSALIHWATKEALEQTEEETEALLAGMRSDVNKALARLSKAEASIRKILADKDSEQAKAILAASAEVEAEILRMKSMTAEGTSARAQKLMTQAGFTLRGMVDSPPKAWPFNGSVVWYWGAASMRAANYTYREDQGFISGPRNRFRTKKEAIAYGEGAPKPGACRVARQAFNSISTLNQCSPPGECLILMEARNGGRIIVHGQKMSSPVKGGIPSVTIVARDQSRAAGLRMIGWLPAPDKRVK